MNKKKTIMKIIAKISLMGILIAILYFMFKDLYVDILNQLLSTNIYLFVIMLLLGNAYFIIDAAILYYLFKSENEHVSYLKCIALSYMSVFFNVTTFGAGIKPAQTMYLHRKGVDIGKGFAIVSIPYLFHKTVVVMYAIIMILISNGFFVNYFPDTFRYIYIGIGFSILIVTFIILIFTNKPFHNRVFKIIHFFLKKKRFSETEKTIKSQIDKLREGTKSIMHNPKAWFYIISIDILKLSCWYIIPVIGLSASGGSLGDVSILEALSVTAVMQLIMGVIPVSGGVGSQEIVFSLLFAVVFGPIMAGSCMILYRLSTYYVPFLISIVIMFVVEKDSKPEKYKMILEDL